MALGMNETSLYDLNSQSCIEFINPLPITEITNKLSGAQVADRKGEGTAKANHPPHLQRQRGRGGVFHVNNDALIIGA